jgi:hypothetical protein
MPHASSHRPTQQPKTNEGPVKWSSDCVAVLNNWKKHTEFWDLDSTVVLQVDDVIFRVMRSALSKASSWFWRFFSEDFENLEITAGCPVYLIKEGISHLDFANLLRGLEDGL